MTPRESSGEKGRSSSFTPSFGEYILHRNAGVLCKALLSVMKSAAVALSDGFIVGWRSG
jgi:hypothetical protein